MEHLNVIFFIFFPTEYCNLDVLYLHIYFVYMNIYMNTNTDGANEHWFIFIGIPQARPPCLRSAHHKVFGHIFDYINIYICICIHEYIWTYVIILYFSVYIHKLHHPASEAGLQLYLYICVGVCKCMYTQACIYIYIYVYVYKHMNKYIHIHGYILYTYIYISI